MFADQIDRPSTAQLGLTPDVFAPFVPRVAGWMFGRLGDLPAVKERAEALYLDPTLRAAYIARVVPPPGIERITTDTYPHEEVDVTCEDGRTAQAQSEQNSSTFMLPWTVTIGTSSFQTYNAEIPRAMFSMLGKLDVNPYSISDEGMAEAYVSDLRLAYIRRYGEPDALQLAPGFEARLSALGYTPSFAFLERGTDGRVDFHFTQPISRRQRSLFRSVPAPGRPTPTRSTRWSCRGWRACEHPPGFGTRSAVQTCAYVSCRPPESSVGKTVSLPSVVIAALQLPTS